jgi:hypothetical protein
MKYRNLIAAAVLSVSAAPAFAFGLGDVAGVATGVLVDGKVIAGVNYGTLGAGGELGYKVNDFFAVRGVHSMGLSYDNTFTYDSQDVDFSIGAKASGLMLDYHPFGGGMRLSGGLWKTDIGADFGTDYTVSDNSGNSRTFALNGDLSLPSTAPGASIGWHGGLGDRITIGADFGAIMTGGAELSTAINGDFSDVPQSERDKVDAEMDRLESEINEYTKYLNFYPVAQVGVTFRF